MEGDQLILKGTHRLGFNFNKFIQYHLKYHLQRFGYDISRIKSSYIEEEDNSIFDLEITMKKKNNK
jgi:protein-tyrosine-phosphatase